MPLHVLFVIHFQVVSAVICILYVKCLSEENTMPAS